MTVPYSAEVANCNIAFLKLLFRWKGSIYKLVWLNLTLYMMFYFFLSYLYREILDREQQIIFEKLCVYCRRYTSMIPLSFILGFYVSHIMDRWWAQFSMIPWPDGVALAISTSITGKDEKSRMIRRTIMRYINLAFVMAMQLISPPAKERFPTYEHMITSGLLLESEKAIIDALGEKTNQPKYWVPLVWAANVAAKARKEKKVLDEIALNYLVQEICHFRSNLQILLCYDWVYIPLVYPQVVTLAVYLYFTVSIMARQFLKFSEFVVEQRSGEVDLHFPIFLFIEFFFYMGWLNVAETLVNPFGSDDDDFEINYLIDRHISVSYLMVDEVNVNGIPEMVEDLFWDEEGPIELPYTEAAAKYKTEGQNQLGSTAHTKVSGDNASFRLQEKGDVGSFRDSTH